MAVINNTTIELIDIPLDNELIDIPLDSELIVIPLDSGKQETTANTKTKKELLIEYLKNRYVFWSSIVILSLLNIGVLISIFTFGLSCINSKSDSSCPNNILTNILFVTGLVLSCNLVFGQIFLVILMMKKYQIQIC